MINEDEHTKFWGGAQRVYSTIFALHAQKLHNPMLKAPGGRAERAATQDNGGGAVKDVIMLEVWEVYILGRARLVRLTSRITSARNV
jgi:hypothetical protein